MKTGRRRPSCATIDAVRYEIEPLITVRTFAAPWAAQLARARLEAAGIEAVVADEHLGRMFTLNTVGGARLQVREGDAAAALDVLSRQAALPELYLVTEEDAARPRCPGCKSERVYFERWSRLGFVSSWILLGIPIPIPKSRWLCRSCGAAWKEEDLPPRRRPGPPPEIPEPALADGAEEAAAPHEEIEELEDGALVAVARFTAPWEAHLARTRLEADGIAACVLEERLPLANLVSGQLAALSRVAVHPEDARRAREILGLDDGNRTRPPPVLPPSPTRPRPGGRDAARANEALTPRRLERRARHGALIPPPWEGGGWVRGEVRRGAIRSRIHPPPGLPPSPTTPSQGGGTPINAWREE